MESRDALEVERQKLLSEQQQLTTEVGSIREQLHSAESLNQLYETKIGEQQSHIDALLDECKQVGVSALLQLASLTTTWTVLIFSYIS